MTNGFKSRIAVIGSGISGLSAAWLLSKTHDVTIFEKCDHIGGHSNTRNVTTASGNIPVDTGFIVYNEKNYPNLTAFFKHLDVPTSESSMSFAYSVDRGRYEYGSGRWSDLFGQPKNIVSLRHWQLLKDIKRFFAEAQSRVETYPASISMGDFLRAEQYSEAFVEDHILPMAGAIWSSPAETMEGFPARSFLEFYSNHGLLQVYERPQWRSVLGGSKEYVRRILENSAVRVVGNAEIASIKRNPAGVRITQRDGSVEAFDQVVLACHADTAYALLSDRDPLEEAVLSNFRYSDNRVVLHTDASHMPKRRKVWSSWNYMRETANGDQASVTYWMNSLQSLGTDQDIFVTVNPGHEIDPDSIHYETSCHHPVLDGPAVDAQQVLWELQGRHRTWFCGSYFGYGFHEDGLQSGLAVAEQLGGVRRPWIVPNESGRIQLSSTVALQAAE